MHIVDKLFGNVSFSISENNIYNNIYLSPPQKDIKIMNTLTAHEVPLFQLNTKDVSLERKSMYSSFVVAPYVS